MGFLTALIPMPWRIAIMMAALIGAFGYGFVKGEERESDKREAALMDQAREMMAASARKAAEDEGMAAEFAQRRAAARGSSAKAASAVARSMEAKGSVYDAPIDEQTAARIEEALR